MTAADRARFGELFASLAKAFTKPADPELAAVYFAGLEDYPIALVEAGKLALIRSSKFFPRVRDWRAACDEARTASTPRPTGPRTVVNEAGEPEAVFCCARCQDTGWAPACGCALGSFDWRGECAQHPRVIDGRPYRQAMHACACRESNPEFQRGRPRVDRAS